MLRRAEQKDRAELISLWRESFGDSAEDIESFFKFNESAVDAFVCEADGGIVAALYALECTLCGGEKELKARYIYAVSTREKMRGQGVMSRLIPYAHERLAEQGVEAFWLCPAGDELVGFYEKFGYRRVSSACRRTVEAKRVDMDVGRLGADAAARLREWLLRGKNAVGRSAQFLKYAASFYGAEWYEVGDALALVEEKRDSLFLHELLSDVPDVAAQGLCTYFGAERAEAVLPYWCEGETTPMPMVKYNGYLPDGIYTGLELN